MRTVVFAGIGRLGIPSACRLADEGWRVAVSFREGRTSEKTVKQLIQDKGTDKIIGFNADLSNKKNADNYICEVLKQTDRIDALIIIASGYPDEQNDWQRWQNGSHATDDDWRFYHSNFTATRNVIQATLEQAPDTSGLNILTFTDARSLLYMNWDILDPYKTIGGITRAQTDAIKKPGLKRLQQTAPDRHINPYTLAKIDIAHLTRKLAVDLGDRNIRINSIAPGPMLPPPDKNEQQSQTVIDQTLLKRWGKQQPITDAIDYFLNADFVTGQIHFVDGGLYLKMKHNS